MATDWEDLKRVYVEGEVNDQGERSWPSPERCAYLFDLPDAKRILERIRREGWDNQKSAWQAHLEKVRQERRNEALAKEASAFDEKALAAAKVGIQLAQIRTTEMIQKVADQRKAKAQAEANGDPYDDLGLSAVDAKELYSLAGAAEIWQRIGAKALGDVETTRTEITGAGGAPLEVQTSVRAELVRDDSDRTASVLSILGNVGVLAIQVKREDGSDAAAALEAAPEETGDSTDD